MGRTRRIFTRDFKIDIINQVQAGKPIGQVARENDLHPTLVNRWKREYAENPEKAFSGRGNPYKDTARFAELERLVGRLYAEKDLLMKALETLGKQNNDERKKRHGGEIHHDQRGRQAATDTQPALRGPSCRVWFPEYPRSALLPLRISQVPAHALRPELLGGRILWLPLASGPFPRPVGHRHRRSPLKWPELDGLASPGPFLMSPKHRT